jgi:ATP-dependent RNA helicase DeaD
VLFQDLGLSEPTLRALRDLGYEEPTPIQETTIEHLLRDRDVVGQAQTGTGKTAAFMLPILERIDADIDDVQALVLCPTRELALQVTQATRDFARYRPGVRSVAVYGGAPIHEQLDQLRRGAQIVIGTPGRVLDLLRRGKLLLHDARMIVLDESDEMLSMGFIDDVRAILRRAPQGRQTALFSATLPDPIRKLAEDELHDPRFVRVAPERVAVAMIAQSMVETTSRERIDTLERVLSAERPATALVFTRTKVACRHLAEELARRGYRVRALHGDLSQSQRDSVMIAFRTGRCRLLVATGVAARGLDVSHVSHVINYELPDDAESYVHRIGRTGRAGSSGIAISLVTSRDKAKLAAITALTRMPIAAWREPGVNDTFTPPTTRQTETPVAQAPTAPVADAVTTTGTLDADEPKRRRRRGRRGGRRQAATAGQPDVG